MRIIVFNTVFLFALLGACPNAFGQRLAAIGWEITEAIAADQFKAKLRIANDSGAILHVSLGPKQRLLTLVMADGTVRLWDLNAGVQRAVIPAAGEAPSALGYGLPPWSRETSGLWMKPSSTRKSVNWSQASPIPLSSSSR
jgi:hypothetical protein